MNCTWIRLPHDRVAILCGRSAKRLGCDARPQCGVAGCDQPATRLCDFPLDTTLRAFTRRKTCDAPLCDAHASGVGAGRDLCPPHVKVWRAA